MINRVIMLKQEGYGWCKGVIVSTNTRSSRKIKGDMVNFIAKFEVDEGTTALVLTASNYDTEASAEYDAWMLLKSEEDEDDSEDDVDGADDRKSRFKLHEMPHGPTAGEAGR